VRSFDHTFKAILADPPYHHRNKLEFRKALHPSSAFETMSNEAIARIPVHRWAADPCVLGLWVPPPFVDVGIDVLRGWGFRYVTSIPWLKTWPVKWTHREAEVSAANLSRDCIHIEGGACAFCIRDAIHDWPYPVGNIRRGAGTWFMQTWEQVLWGEIGAPGIRKHGDRGVLALLLGHSRGLFAVPPKRHHSAKPYDVHSFLEAFPGPHLELFATEERPGWTTWGYDTGFRLTSEGVERGDGPEEPGLPLIDVMRDLEDEEGENDGT
jgi:N6-adenosine-specific RNA methylase IME4